MSYVHNCVCVCGTCNLASKHGEPIPTGCIYVVQRVCLIENCGVRKAAVFRFGFVDEHLHASVEVGADQNVAAALLALFGHRIGNRSVLKINHICTRRKNI